MALVSVIPLATKSCLRRSFISSTHELKPLCRTIPTLGMWRRGKYFTPSIKMCLRTTVSDDDSVQRRVADYHSNLWDDGFIQSLSTPYEAPSYRERADTLILEVKDIFNSMSAEDGELISPLNDLRQRLWMVDSVERLGTYRHFKQEIKSVLDYVYSYWNNEKGIGCGRDSVATDLNSTALGFRIFRLHGYRVSSHVLEHFKDQEGQFACSTIQSEGEIRSVLNLFRASLIAFSGEKVMEEAEMFTTIYLKETLQKIPVSSLSHEIEYALEYGWHTNLPRLEARNYIDVFGRDPISQTTDMTVEKLSELSKLEFNIFHSLQQKELKHVSSWWKDSGFSQLTFTRHRHVEFYTLASCIAIEPEHSAFRLGFAKVCHIGTILDDIYDTFGRMEEIELFTAAVKRWHPSATEWLPEYMKGMYKVLYETVNEMAREAEKCQGRDTLNDARQGWEAYIDSYMKEAKWISSGYLPTFEEYLENGKVSFGYRIAVLQPILMLGISFPPRILQEIGYPSRLNDLACSILRLKGDIRTYQAERSRGEKASCISCYMKDNPESTEEDAVTEINAMVDNKLKELNWEFVRPYSNVPMSSKKHAFDILRALYYLYKYRDGISVTRKEIQNLVTRVVLEPVPL